MRIVSIIIATLLFGYMLTVAVFFSKDRLAKKCSEVQIVVRDSLDKHFVNEKDVALILRQVGLHPVGSLLADVNTEMIENALTKNQMIRQVEAYKTPSGIVKLEIIQKMPVLRIMGDKDNYYVDNEGKTMPVSPRYVAHVPLATGYVEKKFAMNELYKFALFLQENKFWNNQIQQINVRADDDVELIPRVGNHRIVLGSLDNFETKLDNLRLFYRQALPHVGWDKYSIINLKYKNQIVCTKK